ncbi:unknown [Bacteroides sp. CAG:1060]|nr:unknown [Bacteroides sp. CAG:1060]
MATDRIAIHQFWLQFWIADPERVRPIAMMIGPVTTGGKKRITFLAPKAAKRPASTKYMNPAQKTPIHA